MRKWKGIAKSKLWPSTDVGRLWIFDEFKQDADGCAFIEKFLILLCRHEKQKFI